jgi:hypothetical protein
LIKQKGRHVVLSPGVPAKVVRRAPLAGIAVVSIGLVLAACGGGGSSGPSAEQVAQLRRQGAEHVHKEERIRRLERELKGVKHKVKTTTAPTSVRVESSTPTPVAPTEPTPTSTSSSSIRSCDQNISADEATSCPLAENVFVSYWEDYESSGEEPETYLTAYSPTSQQSYGLNCTFDGTTVDCTGGSEIFVTFPMWAVRVY